MSAKNDFKAFAISDKANVPSQQEYEAYDKVAVLGLKTDSIFLI
ncbi:DNA-packaging protein, partial [Photorhabdus luminescens]